MSLPIDLSVLLLVRNEAQNLQQILPELLSLLGDGSASHEVIVVDGQSVDNSPAIAAALGCRVVHQNTGGYGEAFRLGTSMAQGRRIVAIDADMSHPLDFIRPLLLADCDADVVVASRFAPGGGYEMPRHRALLSLLLSFITRNLFNLPVRDCSSGFRVYRTEALRSIPLRAENFDILIEVLVRIAQAGGRVREIPFQYRNRGAGISKARVMKFLPGYIKTIWRLKTSLPKNQDSKSSAVSLPEASRDRRPDQDSQCKNTTRFFKPTGHHETF